MLEKLWAQRGHASTQAEAKEICQRMLAFGLLQPFCEGVEELGDDDGTAPVFNVRTSTPKPMTRPALNLFLSGAGI